ncbi:hypothetical protein SODALDRAFT_182460 [Sodiomyces alkalinus F11]|uniref:Uncharacterized protein n=1 Tax=Sodiomyces alkalinus (strain CBS 110278 / VKM F-3762 / F11) TaxID=1314773 RepID=A0A3N2PUG6_SODAK|nr:hypothetical protein SODALDRAFT_182460 [Sodiomyces alkalinus F11]ROT38132.1 hypothetical protein SODALDRAFT_182460 [Sodiomyces alkalinus F11]
MSASNMSQLCTNNNADSTGELPTNEWTIWSGCGVPTYTDTAPYLQSCCEALDGYVFSYQDVFPLLVDSDAISDCWANCMVNISGTYWADSMNITECLIANDEQYNNENAAARCAGPAMRTPRNLATRQTHPGGLMGWSVGIVALAACLLTVPL